MIYILLLYLLTLHLLFQPNSGVKNCYFLCLSIYLASHDHLSVCSALKVNHVLLIHTEKREYLGQDMLLVCVFISLESLNSLSSSFQS